MNALARAGAVAAAALLVAACSEPIPLERADYVGVWRGTDVFLQITAAGAVNYERRGGSGNVKIQAPLKRFDGDDFIVGIGPFTTRFKVSRPPHLDGARWRMVVDGVPLTRAGSTDEFRA